MGYYFACESFCMMRKEMSQRHRLTGLEEEKGRFEKGAVGVR